MASVGQGAASPTALSEAAERGDAPECARLFAPPTSADCDSADCDSVDCDEYPALRNAARHGHVVVVRLLLWHRADPGCRAGGGTVGATALHFAADPGHDGCVRALLSTSADPTSTDRDGRTTADYAESGHADLASLVRDPPLEFPRARGLLDSALAPGTPIHVEQHGDGTY
jgi:hypothetical protein